jgi:SAM-dependent methyltransferase
LDEASFIRYLSSKKSVDDRALNRRVWDAMVSRAGSSSPRVLELGGGIGTMIERAAADGGLKPRSWTLIDEQQALIEEARRRLAGRVPFTVDLQAMDVQAFIERNADSFDLVIANAFLDLFDPQRLLPGILKLARSGGSFLFSITFDGLTAWEPEIDPPLDRKILDLYHRTMDERLIGGEHSGDSKCGRHLLTLLPRCGYRILEAGSSDWLVLPRDGGYPADERFFLECILGFFEESLAGHPGLDRREFSGWLEARRAQLSAGELVFMAHQLDVLAAPAP